jgi:hypothetical protein
LAHSDDIVAMSEVSRKYCSRATEGSTLIEDCVALSVGLDIYPPRGVSNILKWGFSCSYQEHVSRARAQMLLTIDENGNTEHGKTDP